MADLRIETPRGCIIKTANGKAELTWNQGSPAKRQQNFQKAQIFVDSEVLRLCSPLEIGSGEVRYIAPYAAAQYYNTAESRPYDSQRGAKWFERMKVGHKKEILIGARKIAGGG